MSSFHRKGSLQKLFVDDAHISPQGWRQNEVTCIQSKAKRGDDVFNCVIDGDMGMYSAISSFMRIAVYPLCLCSSHHVGCRETAHMKGRDRAIERYPPCLPPVFPLYFFSSCNFFVTVRPAWSQRTCILYAWALQEWNKVKLSRYYFVWSIQK